MTPAELRAPGRLGGQAFTGVVSRIEQVHQAWIGGKCANRGGRVDAQQPGQPASFGRPQTTSYGRLRPSRSCAATHSPATTAEPSEISPHKTVAAMISASLRTLPLP
jgi:hypothetical protein